MGPPRGYHRKLNAILSADVADLRRYHRVTERFRLVEAGRLRYPNTAELLVPVTRYDQLIRSTKLEKADNV